MSSITLALPNPPANFSTTLNGGISSSDLSITLNSVSGLSAEGVGVIYQADSDGNPVASTIEFVHWTNISSNTLTLTDTGDRGISGSASGAQAHSNGDKFEVWIHPEYHFRDWAVVEHNADGTHGDVNLSNSTDFTSEHNADGTHKNTKVPTVSGGYATILTATGPTNVTLPTTGTLSTLAGAEALTNKTIQSPRGWDGWKDTNETWTYVSTNSFKVSGVDVTAKYPKGTRVKFTQTTVKYGIVYSSAFSTDTTITLIANDDYSVANAAISDNYYSYEVNPQNFPFWFNYTSTDGAGGSMTWGTITTSYCKFRVIGKEMNVAMKKLGTTGGSASTSLTATLPCNAARESYQNTLIFNTGTVTNGLTRVDSGSTTITMQIIPVGNFSLGANTGILGSNIIVEI